MRAGASVVNSTAFVKEALQLVLVALVCACGGTAQSAEPEESPCTLPRTGLIADFATGARVDDGGGLYGGVFAYPERDLVADTTGGDFHVRGRVWDYSGIGVWFGSCVDASEFDALRFRLGGSLAGANPVTVVINTRENDPASPVTALGTCTPSDPSSPFADCQSPVTEVSVAPSLAEFVLPFATFARGQPNPTVDPNQITGLALWLPWSDGAASFDVDLTLDDLSFAR